MVPVVCAWWRMWWCVHGGGCGGVCMVEVVAIACV